MKLYSLCVDEGKKKKYAYAFPTYGYPTDEVVCKVCKRRWDSFSNIIKNNLPYPISFISEECADFTACEGFCMVNQKVKEVLEDNFIQSPCFAKMPVVSKNDLTPEQKADLRNRGRDVNKISEVKPVYYMLSAAVGGMLHPDSGIEWVDYGDDVCTHCGYGVGYRQKDYFAPIYFQLDTWNGSDIFRVKEFGASLFCTDKFREICISNHFTGVIFREIQCK